MPSMDHLLWLAGGILLGWLVIPMVLGVISKRS